MVERVVSLSKILNPSLAILNLTRRYTEAELEDACSYALSKVKSPRCK